MFKIEYKKKAIKDLKNLEKDRKLLLRFRNILDNIKENPYSPNFKFERLKGNFSGYCSKRLDDKNRVIYEVVDDKIVVIIISIIGHYD